MLIKPFKSQKEFKDYSNHLDDTHRIIYTKLFENLNVEFKLEDICSEESFNFLKKIGLIMEKDDGYVLRCFVPKFPKRINTKGTSPEVISVIKLWTKINPSANVWYNNTTFKKDIQVLIDTVGIDQLKVIVYAFVPFGNLPEFTYVPNIETPRKLLEKLSTYRNTLESNGVFKKYQTEMNDRIKELNL